MRPIFLLLFFLLIFPHAVRGDDAVRMKKPKIRLAAPTISAFDLTGQEFRLEKHRGKVILLNFWATWCVPCRKEMPLLNELQKKFGRDRFLVIGIAVDRNLRSVKKTLEKHQIQFGIIMDSEEAISKKYEVDMLPVTYLIGKDGKFTGKFTGERDWINPNIMDLIEKELEK